MRDQRLKTVTETEALKAEIAALTKSLYEAYNKINDLQAYIHEEIQTSSKKNIKKSEKKG